MNVSEGLRETRAGLIEATCVTGDMAAQLRENRQFDIVTWNVNFSSDPQRTAELLGQMDGDRVGMFGLQEVMRPLRDILTDPEDPHWSQFNSVWVPSTRHRRFKNNENEGLLLLSRFPIRTYNVHELSSGRNVFGARKQKTGTYLVEADMELGDDANPRPFRYGFSHMSYYVPVVGARNQRNALQSETDALKKAISQKHPDVLAGDFNAGRDSERIRSLEDEMRRIPTGGPTWVGKRIVRSARIGGRYIDHAFTNVFQEDFTITYVEEEYTSLTSDHRPVRLSVTIG